MNRVTRDRYLRKTYGITLEEWEAILAEQGGGCAACGKSGVKRALHTDHSHTTGMVRGILCIRHNAALQKIQDDANIADALARYLRNPPAVAVLGREQIAINPPKTRRRRYRSRTPNA